MSFLKSLFRSTKREREHLRQFVNQEYRPMDREAVYNRLIREANL